MKVCDIHCHLLPGVDDGPDDLTETLAMLHAAWESGTRTLVATPHLYAGFFPSAEPTAIRETFATVLAEIERLRDRPEYAFLGELELHLGAEHFFDWPFLQALERGEVLPLAEGRHLLVEFPLELPEQTAHAGAVRILEAGYTPVLAHVERYSFVREKPERLERFIDMGCVAQANVDGSARFGGSPRLLRRLLKRGLVQILATDGHSVARRPPQLGPGAEALAKRFSRQEVEAWAWGNPLRVIGGDSG